MVHMSIESSLLIVNGKAGNGQATELSQVLNAETGIRSEHFGNFLLALECVGDADTAAFLESYSNLFILGGDGSTLSLMRLLLQQQLRQDITVAALGMGGENVVAKETGTFKKPLKTIRAVLTGAYQKEAVIPLSVTAEKSEIAEPFLWSVHMGFSAAVLAELEEMRSMGMGDFRRRYQATLQTLFRQRQLDPTYVSLNGESTQSVLDVGVLSAALPYWTSKFRLATVPHSPALLHTVQGYDELQKEPGRFSSRLLLEVLALKFGLNIPYRLLQHQPLASGFSVEISSPSGQMAIDSEVSDSAESTVTDKDFYPGGGKVFLARF